MENLRTVLRRLSKHGIKLKTQPGRTVSQNGHRIDPEGAKAVIGLKESGRRPWEKSAN